MIGLVRYTFPKEERSIFLQTFLLAPASLIALSAQDISDVM